MDFTPLSVRNRYGLNANSKPTVAKLSLTNDDMADAKRTYAIILSGGISKQSNYERYWNDCSFIYQTLVNKYGIPKGNIYPIMSDGNNPAADMLTTQGTYASQSLDLDKDGVADIQLAATKDNVRTTLNSLASKLQKDDQLFIYVIDHGGATAHNANSYICLWNNEKLYDYELASMLNPFTAKYVNINVVLGQCFSGGFIKHLNKLGIVIATASGGLSWACPDKPYDEFVYHWTCAVNKANHYGIPVNADTDGNGRVTMDEAFNYAKANDRRHEENPEYLSTPSSVGEDLAFNHLAPSVDLYIKDNPEDTGKEPNTTTDEFWKSPSICVRNKKDGIFEHQNPEYSSDHEMAYIYVRIHNRGKEDFLGGNKWLLIYWAKASTGIATKTWKGREVNSSGDITGGHTNGKAIVDTIPAGEFRDIVVNWALPDEMHNSSDGNYNYCLLAKIMDTPYDDGYVDGKIYYDILGQNDQAQKNVTIIKGWTLHALAKLYVRNVSTEAQAYTLEFVPQTSDDEKLFNIANVKMAMSQKIFSAWERGGLQAQDVEMVSSDSNNPDCKTVKLLSKQSKLENVKLNANEFDTVDMIFDFTSYSNESKKYTFDLIQRDSNGAIVGGETFIIEPPVAVGGGGSIGIEPTPVEDGQYQLNAVGGDFSSYRWLDQNGEIISDSQSVYVKPRINNDNYRVIATTDQGTAAEGEISLESEYGIRSVAASNGSDCITIRLHNVAPENSTISIASILDGDIKATKSFPAGTDELTVDATALASGPYLITYSVGFEVIDQRKLILQ